MIELRGQRIVLRTLEREHCRILWQQFEPAQPVPTESLSPGLSAEYNTAAQHVLSKCGFVQEGREREAIYCAGRRWDRLIYGLLRSDYERVSSS
ncbi:MAG: GNAT family N-acetyltransferase [Chloroflexi bacterium]|nr:GNAT family N-acetyltransferase [Chloroflexota bacterium]